MPFDGASTSRARRRGAASRRLQRRRAEARRVASLLNDVQALLSHRGGQPSRLHSALATALGWQGHEPAAAHGADGEEAEVPTTSTKKRKRFTWVPKEAAKEPPEAAQLENEEVAKEKTEVAVCEPAQAAEEPENDEQAPADVGAQDEVLPDQVQQVEQPECRKEDIEVDEDPAQQIQADTEMCQIVSEPGDVEELVKDEEVMESHVKQYSASDLQALDRQAAILFGTTFLGSLKMMCSDWTEERFQEEFQDFLDYARNANSERNLERAFFFKKCAAAVAELLKKRMSR